MKDKLPRGHFLKSVEINLIIIHILIVIYKSPPPTGKKYSSVFFADVFYNWLKLNANSRRQI